MHFTYLETTDEPVYMGQYISGILYNVDEWHKNTEPQTSTHMPREYKVH